MPSAERIDRGKFLNGALVLIVAGLLWATAGVTLSLSSGSVDGAQADFERMESMWNWPGWRTEGKLKCINRVKQGDEVLLRTCRVASGRVDPFSGVETRYDAAFACSPETCAWAIEP